MISNAFTMAVERLCNILMEDYKIQEALLTSVVANKTLYLMAKVESLGTLYNAPFSIVKAKFN